MKFVRVAFVGLFLAGCVSRPSPDLGKAKAALLDIFPPPVAQTPQAERGKTVMSSSYTPSGSSWGDDIDERTVFHEEMKHRQGKDNSFALRIGKGGQIYSLRGPFGESIPPSSAGSPWNDEVWQFVSVCLRYNGPDALAGSGTMSTELKERLKHLPYETWYFVHNSGAYIPGNVSVKNLYCPMFASEVAGDGRIYRTVNWGLVPQPRTINRSPLLYYVQTRDVGDGIIEVTYVVHNFSARSDIVFDHLNAPWGGTRISSLPCHGVSAPDGTLLSRRDMRERMFSGGKSVRDTGGWNLSSVTEAPDSPSLALVYGRDRYLEAEAAKCKAGEPFIQFAPSVYRDWDATGSGYEFTYQDWQTRPANSWRNYDVAVVIPKFRLAPGTTIWYRSFLVVNRRDRTIELAKKLVDKVDYGMLTFNPDVTPKLPVFIQDGKVVEEAGDAQPAFELFAWPVPGALPLFLIENATTGQQVVTTDPYYFVPKEKLDLGLPPDHPKYDYYSQAVGYSMDRNNSRWQRLLGFGYVKKPAGGSFVPVSGAVGPQLFPKPDAYHLDVWVARKDGGRRP